MLHRQNPFLSYYDDLHRQNLYSQPAVAGFFAKICLEHRQNPARIRQLWLRIQALSLVFAEERQFKKTHGICGREGSSMENRGRIAETDRLILRRYQREDLRDLFEYLSDPKVVEFEPYKPMTLDEVRENLEWRIGTEEMIAVEHKGSHKMIGNVYLGKREFAALEIGYVFHQEYWGKGYAAESCQELIRQAFSNGIHRIYAECDPNNIRSWKLLEALGFRREAHFVKNVFFWKDENGKPVWKDTYVYAKLEPAGTELHPSSFS